MVKVQNEKGEISVNSGVFTNIVGLAASNCFGVKGMAVRSMTDGLVHLLRKEAMSKGVLVTFHEDGAISIDLHIIVDHGVNLKEAERVNANHCIDFIAVDAAHASKYKASDARVVEDRKTSDHAPIRVTLDK